MKTIWCVALCAVSAVSSAGELLPLSGIQSRHVTAAIQNSELPALVESIPGIFVEPILEKLSIDGRMQRVMLGPLAGRGYIKLRVKITNDAGEVLADEVIEDRTSAWKGTFRPGTDLAMLERTATKAADIVRNHSASLLSSR